MIKKNRKKAEDMKKELKASFEEEKEKNLKLEKEINDLRKQLEEKNELRMNLIKETKEYIEIENENKELKSKLSRFPFTLEEGEKIMSIIFMSSDEKLHYSVICKNTNKFHTTLVELEENFPEYFEKNIIFTSNGKKINIYKTLEQNGIKNNDIIILNQTN